MKKTKDIKWMIELCAVIMIVLIGIAIIMALSRRGQASSETLARFKAVETYSDCTVLVDTETGVSYVQYGDALAPLYDSDGNLYRANGWRDYGT